MATTPVLRIYTFPDAEMYEAARTMRDCFIEDKADFIAFDVDFSDPYSDNWLALIEAAEAMPQDESLNDDLTELTAEVETQMDLCRNKFQDSKFFIEKTFPGNEQRWNKFGFNDYQKARKSQVQMIAFMKNFHTVAEKYKTELIANGYSQAKIDEIDTLRTALLNANQEQELFIKDQPEQTQARHIANNNVWNVMTKTGSAGKIIYKDNFAKYQRYLLPDSGSNDSSVFGLITDQNGGSPLSGVNVLIVEISRNVQSRSNGKYSGGLLADGNYTLTYTLDQYTPQNKSVTIANGDSSEVNVQMVHV